MLCVTIRGKSGMRDAVSAPTGKSVAVIVRNFFQHVLDVARIQAKMATRGSWNNNRANGKGKVRLECAAVVQFMRTERWEALIMVCLKEGGISNKLVGGRLWGGACREWWGSFAKMCVYAWQTVWLSWGDVGRLRGCSYTNGPSRLALTMT